MKIYTLVALLILVLAWSASAQTVATDTTLGANLSDSATTMTVSSNTGFTVGNLAYIDSEVVRISAINGTAISIQRGVMGTPARAHDNTEVVITGAAGHFQTRDPDYGEDCTRGAGQASFSPYINVLNGLVWVCSAGLDSRWTAYSTVPVTYSSIPTSY